MNPSNSVFHFVSFAKAAKKNMYKLNKHKTGWKARYNPCTAKLCGAREVSFYSIRGRNTECGATLFARHFLDLD